MTLDKYLNLDSKQLSKSLFFNRPYPRPRIPRVVLGIVGSSCARPEETKPIIRDFLYHIYPELVVSGRCPKGGVDIHAREVCNDLGWTVESGLFREYTAEVWTWTGSGGFKERNARIARRCSHLLRIASLRSTTYGSGYTADLAERLGKIVIRRTVS